MHLTTLGGNLSGAHSPSLCFIPVFKVHQPSLCLRERNVLPHALLSTVTSWVLQEFKKHWDFWFRVEQYTYVMVNYPTYPDSKEFHFSMSSTRQVSANQEITYSNRAKIPALESIWGTCCFSKQWVPAIYKEWNVMMKNTASAFEELIV